MGDDQRNAEEQKEKDEEEMHNVVKRWSALYEQLLSYRAHDWEPVRNADPKDLLVLKKMLKKAVPQIAYEKKIQARRIQNKEVNIYSKKTIGAKKIKEKIKKISESSHLSDEEKQAAIDKILKSEENHKEYAEKHIARTGVKNKLKRFAQRQEDKINVLMQKHEVLGNKVASVVEHDHTIPLVFFLMYTIYFWQFARLSFMLSLGFGVLGWIISKMVVSKPSGGISFSITAFIFIKIIGLQFLTNPVWFLFAVTVFVFTLIFSQAILTSLFDEKGVIWRRVAAFFSNIFVFLTIAFVIFPIFSQITFLTDMKVNQGSNELMPFLDPIKKGLNGTMLLLTDPMKWYQDYFFKEGTDKSEDVSSKALKIKEMKTYLTTYYSGDSGGGSIILENDGEKAAENVRISVYIPNQKHRIPGLKDLWSGIFGEEEGWYNPMNIARVSLSGASTIDKIAPKQPVNIEFNIRTPASCTGGFTVISKAVYDYHMDTLGTMKFASKAKYDELIKEGKLKRENMETTSASGPISVSMKTMTPMPISSDNKFTFVITPLNLDTGTVRMNNFLVYIPLDFNIFTYDATGQQGCSFSNCEQEEDYQKCWVELHGTSQRCFSTEIGNVYSCPIQLKPEAVSKVIDLAEYTFKAHIDYSYALKSTTQFSVINSMSADAREFKQCPQAVTYEDKYELLSCDKQRDYYYLCDGGYIKNAKDWIKDLDWWDDKKHCFDYNSGLDGPEIESDLKIDMDKLKQIGTIATYLASRADTDAASLSGIDNEFLDDAALISSAIDQYARLKKSETETINIPLETTRDLKEKVEGMVEYTYHAYFLSNKTYKYSLFDCDHWSSGHKDGFDVENLSTIESYTIFNIIPTNIIVNIVPAGKATKPEHIIFIGNKYGLATNALGKRAEWLNWVDYTDTNCTQYYINAPNSKRFCVEIPTDDVSENISQINTLVSDISTAQQKAEEILRKTDKTIEDFEKLELIYELNRILNETIIPGRIGVENDEEHDANEVECTSDPVNGQWIAEQRYCLVNVGTLCGQESKELDLATYYPKIIALEDTVKEILRN
ncbi:MAG: ABC transporter permease [Candidatus Aenigmarchaeota archaeon]|nr:ABC transporter permease [Candidatus Aenigmarchaeota archaeon]